MPVMNGYEAAEQIREMSAQVPIIALTADVVSDVNRNVCKAVYSITSASLFIRNTLFKPLKNNSGE